MIRRTPPPKGIFIAGTDTGVGKTIIACAFIHALKAAGRKVVPMKPVAAGCERKNGRRFNSDVGLLTGAAGELPSRGKVCPFMLDAPLAPHIAAELQRENIKLDEIMTEFRLLASEADCLVVEGVGGFRVPLNEFEDTAHMAARMGLPIVLVVGMRLGCINHALLTAEAIATRDIPFAGWIANERDTIAGGMASFAENVAALQARLPAPLLATVRHTVAAAEAEPLEDYLLAQSIASTLNIAALIQAGWV